MSSSSSSSASYYSYDAANSAADAARGQASLCPEGYRDDDWIMFVNSGPCSLYVPLKILIQYVWITLYGVAILEVTLSRYIFQVDKAPLRVHLPYISILLVLFVSVVYHAFMPDASVRRYPDVVVITMSMYLCLLLAVWLMFASINHLVSVVLGSMAVDRDPDELEGCRMIMNALFSVNFVVLVMFAIAGLTLGVVLPVASQGDPFRQNVYFTIFMCIFCGTISIQGGLYMYMIRHLLSVIESQVDNLVESSASSSQPAGATSHGASSVSISVAVVAESSNSTSISRAAIARSHPAAAVYAGIIVRLRYHFVFVAMTCFSEAGLFIAAAIWGERWFLNIITVGVVILSVPISYIALFRPVLLPRSIANRLGLIPPSEPSIVIATVQTDAPTEPFHLAKSPSLAEAGSIDLAVLNNNTHVNSRITIVSRP